MQCQFKYGPRRALNWGLSDGEGNERDWAEKRHLIAAGRCSSAERRRQLLDAQSLYSAMQKRLELPLVLLRRFKRVERLQNSLDAALNVIFNTPIELAGDNEDNEFSWDQDFIRAQIESQENIWRYWKVEAERKKEYQEVFDSLKREETEERRLLNDRGDSDTEADHSRFPELIERTNQLLLKHGQTREDWKTGGPLRLLFEKEKTTAEKAYNALTKEKDLEKQIKSQRLKVMRHHEKLKKWLDNAEHKLVMLRTESDRLIALDHTRREDWEPGSALWDRLTADTVFSKLEDTRQQLFVQIIRRAIELRNLYSRISGQKESTMVIKAVHRRFPAIKKLVGKYNELALSLPASAAIGTLDASTLCKVMTEAVNPEKRDSIKTFNMDPSLLRLTLRNQGLGKIRWHRHSPNETAH